MGIVDRIKYRIRSAYVLAYMEETSRRGADCISLRVNPSGRLTGEEMTTIIGGEDKVAKVSERLRELPEGSVFEIRPVNKEGRVYPLLRVRVNRGLGK